MWKAQTFTISYNANGGNGAPLSQTKIYGTDITLSATNPTKDGYTFQGWSTSSNGTVSYNPGATYSANADLNLYAVWKQWESKNIYYRFYQGYSNGFATLYFSSDLYGLKVDNTR